MEREQQNPTIPTQIEQPTFPQIKSPTKTYSEQIPRSPIPADMMLKYFQCSNNFISTRLNKISSFKNQVFILKYVFLNRLLSIRFIFFLILLIF